MTPRAQNLALALHMGWQLKWQDSETLRVLNPHGNLVDLAYCNGRTQEETVNDLHYCFPNYHGDLNAVAEVEKTLTTTKQQNDYQAHIQEICYNDYERRDNQVVFNQLTAPSEFRTEAALKTLNLWQE